MSCLFVIHPISRQFFNFITSPNRKRVEVKIRFFSQKCLQQTRTFHRGHPQQTQQKISSFFAFRKLSENVQTGTNLTFFQLTKVAAERIQGIIVLRKFLTPLRVFQQMLNFMFEFMCAFRIQRFAMGMLFQQTLRFVQFFVKSGTGQRRGEVIDNYGRRTAFSLCAFTRIVDYERVQIW